MLDGDGSLLMNLGSLVTIAGQAPKNLVHVVLEGGTYDTSGGQPTPGRGHPRSGAEVAKAAGYKQAASIETEEELAQQWPSLLAAEGPVFVRISVNSMWAFGPMPGLGRQRLAERRGDAGEPLSGR